MSKLARLNYVIFYKLIVGWFLLQSSLSLAKYFSAQYLGISFFLNVFHSIGPPGEPAERGEPGPQGTYEI